MGKSEGKLAAMLNAIFKAVIYDPKLFITFAHGRAS
jgi:hypothetical protein